MFRARHEDLAKTVAVKVLNASHREDPSLSRRFKAEARAASRLDHPHSIRILDFGEDGSDRLLYIVMEFLDGKDLETELRERGPLSSLDTASIMSQVTSALSLAHDLGVVHRDLKPGNIMLVPHTGETGDITSFVKVCDFGLAKILDIPAEDAAGGPMTKEGSIFGTPTYMSPEQAQGKQVDARTDIYAAGIILYRMLAGQPPFAAENLAGLLVKHILEEPEPIEKLVPDADPRLVKVIHKAMKKDPDERFQSMREMRRQLRAICRDEHSRQATPLAPNSLFARKKAAPVPTETETPRAVHDEASVESEPRTASDLSDEEPTTRTAAAPPAMLRTLEPQSVMPAPRLRKKRSYWGPMIGLVLGAAALSIALAHVYTTETEAPLASGGTQEPPGPEKKLPPLVPTPPVPSPVGEDQASKMPLEKEPPRVKKRRRDLGKAKIRRAHRRRRKKDNAKVSKTKNRQSIQNEPDENRKKPALTEPIQPTPAEQKSDHNPSPPSEDKPTPKAAIAKTKQIRPPREDPIELPKPISATKSRPPPSDPKKPKAKLDIEPRLRSLRVQGGISPRRIKKALERQLPSVRECLLNTGSPATQGSRQISVEGQINLRGQLRRIQVHAPKADTNMCITTAFAKARLPRPDTGEASVTFQIRY